MVPALDLPEEEARRVIETIASSGTFWIEWDQVKTILSVKLKQVLSDYPEAKMTTEQQSASLGETHQELVKRLDEALLSFDEGPPFTLQRLCEILLSARSIYPKLSKLALALEKILLVTSMFTSCSNQQMMIQDSDNPEKASEEDKLQSNLEQDGIDVVMGDRDETMAAMEEADVDEGISADMDTFGEIVGPSETSSSPPISS
ncbi:uncharacterized protein LOC115687616 [Syzygium oleosum]|uniref:uncharacterized protein LOC115687616 n=1 Tax=Syzygium oleosum TaxID=219896 RepID=UPI0011D1AA9A|nr:uncharacterized protein LOC115687616 [Syzygium oleosum]XP_056158791.1 uncharacterized protein LOC115687616 [Syzygium oleosum]